MRRLTKRYTGSIVLYAITVLVSLVSYRSGLALCIGRTLLFLLPIGQLLYQQRDNAR